MEDSWDESPGVNINRGCLPQPKSSEKRIRDVLRTAFKTATNHMAENNVSHMALNMQAHGSLPMFEG